MEDLAAFNAKAVKRAAAEEREREEYLYRWTVRVKVKSKVFITSFVEIEERRPFDGTDEQSKKDSW